MPAGYSTRCKVCNHPRRVEIEHWVKQEGISFREASRRLGGEISYEAIRRHCDEHFNVREEAAIQYQASQAALEQVATKRVNEIALLDQVIERAARLNVTAGEWLDELTRVRGRIPKSLVDLFSVTAGEVRQGALTKVKLLGEDAGDDDALRRLIDVIELSQKAAEANGMDAALPETT